MRLLIISHMPHHLRDGVVVGWAPTVRELDRLATRFDTVRHIACLHPGDAPASDIAYAADNIELVPVPPSGGSGIAGKLDVLRMSPRYIAAMLRELPNADMVHVRAPAHISLIAMLLLSARRSPAPRWFKYAGNWKPSSFESAGYFFQRWWLSRPWHRGTVTVNGDWPGQPAWVRTFFNPSLDDDDIARGREAAEGKALTSPMQLLYVGRVETPKGAGRAIEILARLRARGGDATLELVGDGPERAHFEQRVAELGIAEHVSFRGWQGPLAIREAYARAHVLLLPTAASEGWPKVLSEGMAFGVVPVAGAVSSIPQYLDKLGCGRALPPDDLDGFVTEIERYVTTPSLWATESKRAVAATDWFSFRHYLRSVDTLMTDLGVS